MTMLTGALGGAGGTHPPGGHLTQAAAAGTAPAIRDRLAGIINDFGLDRQRTAISHSFDAIFRRVDLDTPAGTPPRRPSRLTEDGTPLQFATTVGPQVAGLRIVGDPAPPAGSDRERLQASMTALEELASVLTIAPELAVQRPLIETLVPGSNSQLLADPAGALWLGAAFTRGAVPRMRLYLNTSWGNTVERFARMRTVAAAFGSAEMWRRAEGVLPRALEPLGVALTLGPGNPPCAALYFRSFGLRLDDYVALAREAAGEANAAGIAAFGLALLGNEARYPASTAVLSFGFRAGSDITADLEFCAHCLFRDDVEAQNRMLAVLAEAGIDPAPYLRMLARLQQGAGRSGQPRIHSFVGITGKSSSPAISVYLKPVMVPYG